MAVTESIFVQTLTWVFQILLPHIALVEKVDFHDAEWLLVIEKEVRSPSPPADAVSHLSKATFRTLATSQYAHHSIAGPGILLTVSSSKAPVVE